MIENKRLMLLILDELIEDVMFFTDTTYVEVLDTKLFNAQSNLLKADLIPNYLDKVHERIVLVEKKIEEMLEDLNASF